MVRIQHKRLPSFQANPKPILVLWPIPLLTDHILLAFRIIAVFPIFLAPSTLLIVLILPILPIHTIPTIRLILTILTIVTICSV